MSSQHDVIEVVIFFTKSKTPPEVFWTAAGAGIGYFG
jgi:hypothetical protein